MIDDYLEKLIQLINEPAPRGRPRKLSPDAIDEIFALKHVGCTHKEIGLRVGCSTSFVGLVLSGKRRFQDGLMQNFPTNNTKGE